MNIYSKYPQGYYVYAYIRSKDSITAKAGTPYYIGKGKNERAWESHKRRNGIDLLPSNINQIIILESNLTEIGALALERRIIEWWGRKDLGTGILNNQHEGGDQPPNNKGIKYPNRGPSPYKGIPRSPETIAKTIKTKMLKRANGYISPLKGKKLKTISKLKGRPKSLEHAAKVGAAHKGKIVSEEIRAKLRAIKLGKPNNSTKGPKTLEHRQKLRDSVNAYYERKRNSSI